MHSLISFKIIIEKKEKINNNEILEKKEKRKHRKKSIERIQNRKNRRLGMEIKIFSTKNIYFKELSDYKEEEKK